MELRDTISDWLNKNKLMQLSTAVDGQPWICTVGYAADDDLNIYWFSRTDRRHSVEIGQNNKVAATIVNDPRNRQAIQLTGQAEQVASSQLEVAYELYVNKLGFKPASLEDIKNSDELSLWMIRPTSIYVWDEVNYGDSPKQKLDLKP